MGRRIWTEYCLSPYQSYGEDLQGDLAPPGSKTSTVTWPCLTRSCWRQEMQPRINLSGECWLCIAPRTHSGACYYWIGLDYVLTRVLIIMIIIIVMITICISVIYYGCNVRVGVIAIMRVHTLHVMNAYLAPGGCQPSTTTASPPVIYRHLLLLYFWLWSFWSGQNYRMFAKWSLCI